MQALLSFRNKVHKYNNPKYFEYYCILTAVLGLLAWQFSYTFFASVIIAIAIAVIVIFDDFKYIIPAVFGIIFGYGTGFNIEAFPIPLIILGVILGVVCLVFTIRNRRKIPITKHLISFIGFTILCLIPITWNHNIPSDQGVLYFMHFTWALYLFIYVVFTLNIQKNSLQYVLIAIGYVGLMLPVECILTYIKSIQIYDSYEIGLYYMIGWGILNEAGIMMCVAMPIYFINLVKAESNKRVILELAKLAFIVLGILLTSSRGTYLFGGIEFVLLAIIALVYSKKKKVILASFGIAAVIGLVCVLALVDFEKIIDLILGTFSNGLSDNGRFNLWQMAFNQIDKNPYVKLFGHGMVGEFIEGFSQLTDSGWDLVYVVYHSTILQTFAAFGLLGLICLVIHAFEKYTQLIKLDRSMCLMLVAGFFMVDMYGMIDNTYHMYYYMIPLIILIVAIESEKALDYKMELFYKR